MNTILIITYYYKHKNAMASVRPMKLAKYFAKQGCAVSVLTSDQKDTWTKGYLQPIPDERIREIYAPAIKRWEAIGRFLEHRKEVGKSKAQSATLSVSTGNVARKKSLKSRLLSWVKWVFYYTLSKQEDRCLFRGLKAEYRRMGQPTYDTVIATYPTYGAFLMGMWLKRRGKCRQFIADFRDPLYNPGFRTRKSEAAYDLKCLKKVVRAADKIVCVSQGIADGIVEAIPTGNKPMEIITNGYDPDDVSENHLSVDFDPQKIHFVYTGTLYHGKRCVDMLAQALRELIAEGAVQPDAFCFQYAGPDFGELLAQLREYGLESAARDHGFVSREQALALQKHADALLLLTWNESQYQGVIPGKLFEYMAFETIPIIALVTGDVENSEVTKLVREAGAGYACEAAASDGIDGLKGYVRQLFDRSLTQQSCVSEYSYSAISQKYRNIM